MLTSLPPHIQNVPPTPAYVEVVVHNPTQIPKSEPKQPPLESDHFGGYITFSGTPASGVSGNVVQSYVPEYTPWEGPIPYLLIQFDFEGHLLEIVPEIRKK